MAYRIFTTLHDSWTGCSGIVEAFTYFRALNMMYTIPTWPTGHNTFYWKIFLNLQVQCQSTVLIFRIQQNIMFIVFSTPFTISQYFFMYDVFLFNFNIHSFRICGMLSKGPLTSTSKTSTFCIVFCIEVVSQFTNVAKSKTKIQQLFLFL